MRIFFFLLAFGLAKAGANCDCSASIDRVPLFSHIVASENECYEKHVAAALTSKKALEFCTQGSRQRELRWGCGKEVISNFINCEGASAQVSAQLVQTLKSFEAANKLGKSCRPDFFVSNEIKKVSSLGAEKIQLHFDSEEEMRRKLKDIIPGAILDRPVDKWEFAVHLPNDNKGWGLFDVLFKSTPNDYGNTHGLKFSAARGDGNGYHLTIEYSTNLYTSKVPGSAEVKDAQGIVHVDQYFLEENLFKLMVDDMDKRNPIYFKAGIGWQNLNNDHVGSVATSAGKQQQEFHKFLNSVEPGLARKYNNVGRGQDNDGLYLEGAFGLQQQKVLSDTMRVRSYQEVGAGGSTIASNTNFVRAEVGASVDYQPSGSKYAARVGSSLEAEKYSGDPMQVSSSVFVEMGKESFKCGTKITRRKGRGPSYHEFDNDNEAIMAAYCRKTLD